MLVARSRWRRRLREGREVAGEIEEPGKLGSQKAKRKKDRARFEKKADLIFKKINKLKKGPGIA